MTQPQPAKESDLKAIDRVLYTARAHTTGGRDGSSRTDDGHLEVKLSTPGTSGAGTNPEQLFAAGWSACFLSAMKNIAGKRKIAFPEDAAIDAEVDLGLNHADFLIQARLNISLPGLDRETAQSLVEAGHQICPYSKATRGNIHVTLNLL
jgi:Ohr subfamily peroxiredoxin